MHPEQSNIGERQAEPLAYRRLRPVPTCSQGSTSATRYKAFHSRGALDYGLIQDSTGVSNVLTIQNERQVQRGIQVGSAANFQQSQNGPRKGSGSAQVGNSNDTWTGRQTSTQIQTRTLLTFMKVADVPSSWPDEHPRLFLAATACRARWTSKQTATQNNGAPVTNTCSAEPMRDRDRLCIRRGMHTDAQLHRGSVIDPTTGECISPCTECCSASVTHRRRGLSSLGMPRRRNAFTRIDADLLDRGAGVHRPLDQLR